MAIIRQKKKIYHDAVALIQQVVVANLPSHTS